MNKIYKWMAAVMPFILLSGCGFFERNLKCSDDDVKSLVVQTAEGILLGKKELAQLEAQQALTRKNGGTVIELKWNKLYPEAPLQLSDVITIDKDEKNNRLKCKGTLRSNAFDLEKVFEVVKSKIKNADALNKIDRTLAVIKLGKLFDGGGAVGVSDIEIEYGVSVTDEKNLYVETRLKLTNKQLRTSCKTSSPVG